MCGGFLVPSHVGEELVASRSATPNISPPHRERTRANLAELGVRSRKHAQG